MLRPEELADKVLKNGLNKVRKGLDGLRKFMRLHVTARQALSPANFEGIIRWQERTGVSTPIDLRQRTLMADHG